MHLCKYAYEHACCEFVQKLIDFCEAISGYLAQGSGACEKCIVFRQGDAGVSEDEMRGLKPFPKRLTRVLRQQ
jgi:hypothetical protein